MRKRLPYYICLITGFLCFNPISFSQDIQFNLVTLDLENRGSTVIGMTQDTQGFLWLATDHGLFKYDGYQYSSYHYQSSEPQFTRSRNILYVLLQIKQATCGLHPWDQVWTALIPQPVFLLTFAIIIVSGSLANDTVNVVVQDHEGSLWIGSNAGIDKFDPRTNKFFHFAHDANDPSSLSCNHVKAIYEDKEGTYGLEQARAFADDPAQSGGLNKLDKKTGKFTRYLHDDKGSE